MYYIGIDPGKQGAVAILDSELLAYVYTTPLIEKDYDIGGMKNILFPYSYDVKAFCVIERAQAMPGQGVVSMFEFGRGYGIWLTLLTTLQFKFRIVHARTWTKIELAGAPGEGKERAYHVAKNLFPPWNPKTKKQRLEADAILLANYARRIYGKA